MITKTPELNNQVEAFITFIEEMAVSPSHTLLDKEKEILRQQFHTLICTAQDTVINSLALTLKAYMNDR